MLLRVCNRRAFLTWMLIYTKFVTCNIAMPEHEVPETSTLQGHICFDKTG